MTMTSHVAISRGQALVALLVFVIVAVTIASAAVIVIILNSQTSSRAYQGIMALDVAESGAEDALLHLIRDPSYATSSTLTVGSGTATVVTSGTTQKTIVSKGQVGNFIRTVQVTASFPNNLLSVQTWQEIP